MLPGIQSNQNINSDPQITNHMKRPTKLFIILATVTAVYSLFSVILMSDVGQFIALPKSWIITYYKSKWIFGGINIVLLVFLWHQHVTRKIAPRWLMVAATAGVLGCIFAANVLNVLLFPTKQHTATYVSIKDADAILSDDQIVYALEINGEVRGYPQDHLELPHVAGAKIGGEQVAMTYCGLSNLPVAIAQDIGHGASSLSVMAQVNNNLILRDNETGELVQQITGTTEFSKTPLTVYPNTMMTWGSFKELYPDALVFVYAFDRMLDPVLRWFFAETLKVQDDPDKGAAFPTVSLEDKRLKPKELVWGYNAGNEQIAFTHAFAKKNPLYEFESNGEPLVLVYDSSHQIVTLFSRVIDGKQASFKSIDFRGQTESVRLTQKPLHNGVYWMVWSHWFPETKLHN